MRNLSILLVEDDLELKRQLVEYLEIFFDTIYECEDGEKALELYNLKKPNIIISDINIPKMNGLEFIKIIRKNDEITPIIVLSAYTDIEYLLKATELLLIRYLVKPVENDKFKETIFKAIDKIQKEYKIYLNDEFYWDSNQNILLHQNEIVELTNYEKLLFEILLKRVNHCLSYEDIHYYVYDEKEYSLNAITSLIKRVRKKIPKNLIKSCYKEGYKIVIDKV